ncbi:MAG: hypothetical protein HY897_19105 [Deltaproteobacteria bacterium]|nr:hypothetical protein [Deltaproteobacteria bacterium]
MRNSSLSFGAIGIVMGTILVWACSEDTAEHAGTADKKPAPKTAGAASATREVHTPPPPFTEGIFPCSECHKDMETNPARRDLTDEHTGIVFEHDSKNRWCLDCHNPGDRDKLRLASGALIDFEHSYLLCGQCHGPTYRDWKAGVHGKRTGEWNGEKRYYLCAHCHNPHSPRIKPIAPFPAPRPPEGRPFILGGPGK